MKIRRAPFVVTLDADQVSDETIDAMLSAFSDMRYVTRRAAMRAALAALAQALGEEG